MFLLKHFLLLQGFLRVNLPGDDQQRLFSKGERLIAAETRTETDATGGRL